jgi:hypothetical protein
MAPSRARAPNETPTPIPAFAPVESPDAMSAAGAVDVDGAAVEVVVDEDVDDEGDDDS